MKVQVRGSKADVRQRLGRIKDGSTAELAAATAHGWPREHLRWLRVSSGSQAPEILRSADC